MSDKFDHLAKGVAESVTRRQALKRFGLGLATMALAGVGFDALGQSRGRHQSIGGCLPSGTRRQPGHPSDQSRSCAQCCGGVFVCDPDGATSNHCVCDQVGRSELIENLGGENWSKGRLRAAGCALPE